MKNHIMVDGQLLQTNKKYSQLKLRQKEKIYQWMFEAYKKRYLELGKGPGDSEDGAIVSNVMEHIEKAGIWIPESEVYKHYRSIKANLGKRMNKENAAGKGTSDKVPKKPREQAIEELTMMLVYLTRFQEDNKYCRYIENSWKQYDHDTIEALTEKELLFLPPKSWCIYMTEQGKAEARKLLKEYGICDTDLMEYFEFRTILPEETDQAIAMEQECFPPNEACSPEHMTERIQKAPESFLVAVDRDTGLIAGLINGLATNEYKFRDEFFTNADLYNPAGRNIMILGLEVLPEYRGKGLAREIMFQFLRREHEKRDDDGGMVFLTCHKEKVKMYQKMGFIDRGISDSTWGGVEWHDMTCSI